MVIHIEENQLADCLEVIHKGFGTVAEQFGLTEENCHTNGAFMPLSRLHDDFLCGKTMFGYTDNGRIVGFVQLASIDGKLYELEKLSVLPEYRHKGYGKLLIDAVFEKAKELSAERILIGIIDKNTRLKKWYAQNGFTFLGTREFSNLPFTVGYMEHKLI